MDKINWQEFHGDAPGYDKKSVGHTPGPWKVDAASYIRGPKGEHLAGVMSYSETVAKGPLPQDANARLIAAAPDMLAMLKAANEAFFVRGTRQELLKALKDSKALIARAEGRELL